MASSPIRVSLVPAEHSPLSEKCRQPTAHDILTLMNAIGKSRRAREVLKETSIKRRAHQVCY